MSDYRLQTLFLLLISSGFFASLVCGLNMTECIRPLGMESGRISDEQLNASSSFVESSTGARNGRIRTETGSGAWCPLKQIDENSHEWIQVDLRSEHLISGVETQGRWDKGRGMEYPIGYMVEYWRASLGKWARYRDADGTEIIKGNSDTENAVFRRLDGGIVARLVRIIPVAETTRTVCLRFELYGCVYNAPLVSYSMLDGSSLSGGLTLRDKTYDGHISVDEDSGRGGILRGGLGQLFDGALGAFSIPDDKAFPPGWIGWRRESSNNHGRPVIIDFQFGRLQNVSAVRFYVACNGNTLHIRSFRRVRISFSTAIAIPEVGGNNVGDTENNATYSPRTVDVDVGRREFSNDCSGSGELSAKWIRLPVWPSRIAQHLRVELFHGGAEWMMISEVDFETDNISLHNLEHYYINELEAAKKLMTSVDSAADIPTIGGISRDDFLIGTERTDAENSCLVTFGLFGVAGILASALILYKIIGVYQARNATSFVKLRQHDDVGALPSTEKKMRLHNTMINASGLKQSFFHFDDNQPTSTAIVSSRPPNFRKCLEQIECGSGMYAEPSDPSSSPQLPCDALLRRVFPPRVDDTDYDPMTMSKSITTTASSSDWNGTRYRSTPHAHLYYHPQIAGSETGGYELDDEESGGDVFSSPPPPSMEPSAERHNSDNPLLPFFHSSVFKFVEDCGAMRVGCGRAHLCRIIDDNRLVRVVEYYDDSEWLESHPANALCQELEALSRLRHQNIVRIIAKSDYRTTTATTKAAAMESNNNLSYVVEHVGKGCLLDYLLENFDAVSDDQFLSLATQIAAGMSYLESCAFAHGSLCARLCLVDSDLSVKVSFEEITPRKESTPSNDDDDIPFHLSPESIVHYKHTIASDVWSFGVLLWKMFDGCAQQQRADFRSKEKHVEWAQNAVRTGQESPEFKEVLPMPKRCPNSVYERIIVPCWYVEPSRRPTFSDLHRHLQNLTMKKEFTE